jgi:hypothetical protein
MPLIQTELRVQVEGGLAPVLVKRTALQVNSCEQISLAVDGVKPEAPVPQNAAAGAGKVKRAGKKTRAQKRVVSVSYTPPLRNVRFVAIYDGGQANGLRVKAGGGGFVTLAQPLVFTDAAAARFAASPTIVLENESPQPRTAVMLVGSDLAKTERKVAVVRKAVPAPARAEKPASARRVKGSRRKK